MGNIVARTLINWGFFCLTMALAADPAPAWFPYAAGFIYIAMACYFSYGDGKRDGERRRR